MLAEIHIHNFALIEELTLRFDDNLNILSGETGAGKSIIVGAVELLLGERASIHDIRSGSDKAVVEGLFELSNRPKLIENFMEKGIDFEDGSLLMKREINTNGRNKCYINGSPSTTMIFKSISENLFDLHGQHQHQSLLDSEKQLDVFDGFAQALSLRDEVGALYRKQYNVVANIDKLERTENQTKNKLELLHFQIQEIEKSAIVVGEDARLEGEKQLLENFEQLAQTAGEVYARLFGEEGSIIDELGTMRKKLAEITAIDKSTDGLADLCESSHVQLDELSRNLKSYLDALEFDPNRLADVRERLDALYILKKKYGGNLEDVLAYCEDARAEIGAMESSADELKKLRDIEQKTRRSLSKKALKLSACRQINAAKFEKLVVSELNSLGMNKCDFSLGLKRAEDENGLIHADGRTYRVTETGIDIIDFLISPNVGEQLKPLSKIASGGELSRVMLALKAILADTDKIPTLIFDEIDVGIGGKIATTIGEKLTLVSKKHQVLVVTHLAQIASKADYHMCVEKRLLNGRTITTVKELSRDDRVFEIARMLGGDPESDISRRHASQLLGFAPETM